VASDGLRHALFAQLDADLVLLCRDRDRGERALRRLQPMTRGRVQLERVDMADLASIEGLLARPSLPTRVDALVHNAGALFDERSLTAQGFERTFALHVLGPERLCRGLLPRLRRTARSRVIYVSSGGMYSAQLSVAHLQDPPEPFDGVQAYAQAKRAQVVLAEQWAQREANIAFFAMHPGWADTPGVRNALPRFYRLTKPWLRSASEGADTIVYLVASEQPSSPSGAFVFDRESVARHLVASTREDAVEVDKLWLLVERMLAAPV
jgi:dehydrogenase/reductase SDR family protein 12